MMTKMTMELFCGIIDGRNTSPAVFEPVQNTWVQALLNEVSQ